MSPASEEGLAAVEKWDCGFVREMRFFPGIPDQPLKAVKPGFWPGSLQHNENKR